MYEVVSLLLVLLAAVEVEVKKAHFSYIEKCHSIILLYFEFHTVWNIGVKRKKYGQEKDGKWLIRDMDVNEVKVKWPRCRESNSPLFIY